MTIRRLIVTVYPANPIECNTLATATLSGLVFLTENAGQKSESRPSCNAIQAGSLIVKEIVAVALYTCLRPNYLLDGKDIDCVYTRGLAVYLEKY